MAIQFSLFLTMFFLVLLFLLSLLLVMSRSINRNAARNKLPPGPWKLPIIGSIHHLYNSVLPHQTMAKLSQRHGPLMHMKFGEMSAIIISSPEMAEQVLKTHDRAFANRPKLLPSRISIFENQDIILAPCGPYWRQMRKICTMELLNAKCVRSFSFIREDEVMVVTKSIKSSWGTPMNITEKIFSVSAAITARAAFGKRCKDHDAVIQLIREANHLAAGFDVSDLFPSLKLLHPLSGVKEKLCSFQKKIDVVLERILIQHQENLARGGRGNGESGDEDLVDVLLRHQMNGDLECPITANSIKSVILDMLGAGTDASSTAIVWAMSEMMTNPEVMEKAQSELRQALKGKKVISEIDIQGLKYLRLVIKETLRLHPVLPVTIPRESTEQCDIDGYIIPIKTLAIVNIWAIGRDPKYWHDADRFLPERFDRSSIDYNGTDFHYIPFGAGRRICPAISFAIANIAFPLAQLLYQFDWRLPDGMKPEDLDMTEKFGVNVGRKNDLLLVAAPYTPPSEN